MGVMTKIYVYKKPDGEVWADYKYSTAQNYEILEVFNLNDPQKVIDNPGTAMPARVRSLAVKARLEKTQAPVTPPAEVLSSGTFWQRLRWLIQGK